ncbi:hypothetical protein Pryu01_01089 [Paraliobacillus ryukyuensis]|uniref:Heat induced stress protein YflT n=1 Tax=Paraliobacillus ryukyuensis TaxID=200904 RepID=A0A366EFY7_9BACI|nr:hypothetical protein [Paraliobacillus ryukyuensis]RBP00339.1 hypothetical protein DES48_102100 [Paraliobacillus ryukyuensis]
MYRNLKGYFKTKNDAEDVRAKLEVLKVRDVKIDQIPDSLDRTLLAPLVISSSSTPISPIVPYFPYKPSEEELAGSMGDDRQVVLECEVEENDFERALAVLHENDGHVDKSSFQ